MESAAAGRGMAAAQTSAKTSVKTSAAGAAIPRITGFPRCLYHPSGAGFRPCAADRRAILARIAPPVRPGAAIW